MLKKLNNESLVEYESYSRIKLTKMGLEKAEIVVEKYMIIKKFLTNVLKISKEQTHDEACNLEHAFSDESILKLNKLLNKFG